jgi:hypothetical protein
MWSNAETLTQCSSLSRGYIPKHIYGNPPAYSTTTLNRLKVTQQMSAVGHTFMSAAQKVSDGNLNKKTAPLSEQQCQAP